MEVIVVPLSDAGEISTPSFDDGYETPTLTEGYNL